MISDDLIKNYKKEHQPHQERQKLKKLREGPKIGWRTSTSSRKTKTVKTKGRPKNMSEKNEL